MKLKERFLPIILSKLVDLIALTCRFEFHNYSNFLTAVKSEQTILALWHNKLLLMPYFRQKYTPKMPYTAVISHSRDGQILARVLSSLKDVSIISVPSQARHTVLKHMVDALNKKMILVVTPDGPRGPLYKVKPGIIAAAQKAKAQIIPFTWTAKSFWKLNSWDKMIIPKPFTKIIYNIGSPLLPQNETSLENNSLLLEEQLQTLTANTELLL